MASGGVLVATCALVCRAMPPLRVAGIRGQSSAPRISARWASAASDADAGAHQVVRIRVPPDVESEVLAELLLETGAMFVAVEDTFMGTAEEQEIYQPLENPAAAAFERGEWPPRFDYWSNCTIEAGFQVDADIEATLQLAERTLSALLPRVPPQYVPSQDWVLEVQKSWPAVMVGDLWVRFPWHDGTPPLDARASLMLEPGMAFGTGEHATTRMCCEWLQRHLRAQSAPSSVLDYGAGSGILALTALSFGARDAVAVDIHAESNKVAKWNAEQNGLGDRMAVYLPQEAPEDQYDVVVANILAPTLVELAPLLAQRSRPGGWLALSGILLRQVDAVRLAYEKNGFVAHEGADEGGWAMLSFRRRDEG